MSPSAETVANNGAPVTGQHATKVALGGKVIAGKPVLAPLPPPPQRGEMTSFQGSDLIFR